MTTNTTPLKPRTDWPAKLALFLEEKRSQPFDWARNNCAFFACDWLAMRTGVDPASDYRDGVDSALSAARVLGAAEGGLAALFTAAAVRWNWPEVPTAFARRGDIVTIDADGGPALGVCIGARAAFAGPAGIDYRPIADCRRAWRIS